MEEKKQRDLRRHAAENFFNSLEKQLLETFQESESELSPSKPAPFARSKNSESHSRQPIDLSALEEAIADIDQYLQDHSPKPPDS